MTDVLLQRSVSRTIVQPKGAQRSEVDDSRSEVWVFEDSCRKKGSRFSFPGSDRALGWVGIGHYERDLHGFVPSRTHKVSVITLDSVFPFNRGDIGEYCYRRM